MGSELSILPFCFPVNLDRASHSGSAKLVSSVLMLFELSLVPLISCRDCLVTGLTRKQESQEWVLTCQSCLSVFL